jgi:hypothetical protein
MADNVAITPGSGAIAAADDIGGVLYQRVKVSHGADGSATDTSVSDPLPIAAYGELVEAIEAMRMAVHALTRTIGLVTVDPATGRLRAEVVQLSSGSLQVTANIPAGQTVANVTTVATVGNQTQMGGLAAQDQIPALMRAAADNLRRNISVT